jgi:hypothetical protein
LFVGLSGVELLCCVGEFKQQGSGFVLEEGDKQHSNELPPVKSTFICAD